MEIMIVIFLIGLIGSVIGYNMKGSIDEGRYFKTQQAAAQVRELLLLEIAKGADIDDVIKDPGHYLKRTSVVKNVDNILKDGWGNVFVVSKKNTYDLNVTTDKFQRYKAEKKKNSKNEVEKDAEENDESE